MLDQRAGILRPWEEMNAEERKIRIKYLWAKVRMFVFLRFSLNKVKVDVEKRDFEDMLL